MIYLDTHAVVWLYAGLADKFSTLAHRLINDEEVHISPAVRLELQHLFEVNRVTVGADAIVSDLAGRIGLQVCTRPFNRVVTDAMTQAWTRDPFDRLIVAHAAVHDTILLSKDENILRNYPFARWT